MSGVTGPAVDQRAGLPMDPRIRQRRIAVRRDEGRRRLRLAIWATAIAVVGASAWGATRSPLLNVDAVHVRGAARTSDADVIRAAGLDRHPPLADVNPARAAAAIERLAWVERARVARHWPGTVEVTLLERSPLAVAQLAPDRFVLLDPTGRVLAEEPQPPAGLTRIDGAPGVGPPASRVPPIVRSALSVVETMPEPLAGHVSAVRVVDGATLELVLDGRIPVLLGPPTELPGKLVAITTLVQKADLKRVGVIDVRVPTAPVLTRR
jgi:cell division protein FtsQ